MLRGTKRVGTPTVTVRDGCGFYIAANVPVKVHVIRIKLLMSNGRVVATSSRSDAPLHEGTDLFLKGRSLFEVTDYFMKRPTS